MKIADLQNRLIGLGFDVGPAGADGIFGRATMRAVAKFQDAYAVNVQWPGTVGPKTIAAINLAVPGAHLDNDIEPPWTLEARRKIGLQEKANNKSLREYLKSDGSTLGDPAKLPWCGDFMETVIAITLPNEPMVANPYYALNWQKFGRPINIVAMGAIAPFERHDGNGKLLGGHIGQVVGHDEKYFYVLGGNQNNAITITRIAKDRLAGSLRWPLTYDLPTSAMKHTSLEAAISTNEA